MSDAEISSEFEYSASFVRILIPGIMVVTLISFLLVSSYPQFISIFKELISESVWSVLPVGAIFLMISIIIGLLINIFNFPLTVMLEGYYLEQYQRLNFIHALRSMLHKGQWKQFIVYWKDFDSPESGIKGALAYRNLYNYFSHCLYDPRINDEKLRDQLEKCILPTKLGNAFRSIEIYPEWKYGMDGVFFWNRIQLLISEENKNTIDKMRAFVDMFVELTFIFLFAAIIYLIVLVYSGKYVFSVISLIVLMLFSLGSYNMAVLSALRFGSCVRSIFDIYREELWDKIKNGHFNKLDSLPEKERWDSVFMYLWFYNTIQCPKCGKFYESTTKCVCDA